MARKIRTHQEDPVNELDFTAENGLKRCPACKGFGGKNIPVYLGRPEPLQWMACGDCLGTGYVEAEQ
jgi:DnaJ-class molecular chaperone